MKSKKIKLTRTELKIKVRGLFEILDIFDKYKIDYFIGGSVLLGIMRTGDLKNWYAGIAVNMRYEDYVKILNIFYTEFKEKKFIVVINKNNSHLKEKIRLSKNGHFYEITPWYNRKGEYRIRAKYRLPKYLFISGRFEILRKRNVQTFNPPIDYLLFRFGEKWEIEIDSSNRRDFENPRYWRK